MMLMMKGLHNNIKFFVVGGVLELCIIKLLVEIGNGMILLTKNSTNAYSKSITSDLEDLHKVM